MSARSRRKRTTVAETARESPKLHEPTRAHESSRECTRVAETAEESPKPHEWMRAHEINQERMRVAGTARESPLCTAACVKIVCEQAPLVREQRAKNVVS